MLKVVLAVLLPNALGDVVLNLPALALLHGALQSSPQGEEPAPIVLGPRFAPKLFGALPYRVETVAPTRELRHQLLQLGTTHVLLMRSSFRSALEARRAGVKAVGFFGQGRRLVLWRGVERPRKRLKVDEYFRLARRGLALLAGETAGRALLEGGATPYPVLPVPERALQRAAALLRDRGVAGDYLVCCTTAAPRYRPGWKIWPGFPELVHRLTAERGETVVVCPGPGEEAQAQRLAPAALQLHGVDPLTYAALLSGSRGVVSNDTGPMHLAAAVGAPTLGVFGDTVPWRYAPHGVRTAYVGEHGRWPSVDEVLGELGSMLERVEPRVP